MEISQIDNHLIDLYQEIFPHLCQSSDIVSTMNGIFGSKSQWYGIRGIDGKLLCFCTIGQTPDGNIFLYNVGVCQKSRGRGLATLLMDFIVKKYGSNNIYLFVAKDNRPALCLYRKYSFEYVDNVYQPPDGELCLARQVQN